MRIALFSTISIGLVFVAQTASIWKEDEGNEVNGYVQEQEKIIIDTPTQTEDDDFELVEPKPSSLDDLWNENFKTANLPEEINNDLQLFEKVFQILSQPITTPNQIKTELEPILTTNPYGKILIRVRTSTSRDNDEFATSITNIETEEFSNNVEQNEDFVESNQQYPIERKEHEIHSRKDPFFDTIPDDSSPGITNRLADFVARYVANELIDVIESKIMSKSEHSQILLQTETNQYPSSDIDENLKDDIHVAQPVDQTWQGPNEIDPQPKLFKIPPQTNPYTLPGIDKNLIDDLQGPVDQTWQGPDYQVRFKRNSPEGDVKLWWKKGQDDIYLHRFANGSVDQNWSFSTAHIGLFRNEDGNQIQVWDFGQTKLEYITDTKQSNFIRSWQFDKKDEASYWKYRHIIKLWCKANGFFVGEESCLIY